MKNWVMPEAKVEKFVSNEYVAACWGVTCSVPAEAGVASAYDPVGSPDPHVTHRQQFCGDPLHYQIELDENGTPINMIEVQTDGLGDLPCTVYTDGSYSSIRSLATINAGEYIYWTTSSGGTTWHHRGTVSGSTNHS